MTSPPESPREKPREQVRPDRKWKWWYTPIVWAIVIAFLLLLALLGVVDFESSSG